jgi:GAF domain-containing protein/sugar diacid utilization regulator
MASVATRLMRLLLDDVPSDTFDQELADVLASARSTVDEPAADDPKSDVDLALRLRGLLDRNKRRMHDLSALYDAARDLSSLRDVDRVLEAVVRRGRQLLGTDVAYLMLVDDDSGDTYMRATDSTVTPGFSEIRLSLGVGLGGLVAQAAAPRWTANYMGDDRLVHVIDTTVQAEALVAILGVPLQVDGRVIGVLFAADRQPRTFASEEVSLLCSLADHAAIAIEGAGLLQQAEGALTHLSDVNVRVEEQRHELARTADMQGQLIDLVLTGADLAGLATIVADSLGGTVVILSPQGRLLAFVGDQLPNLPSTFVSTDAESWTGPVEIVALLGHMLVAPQPMDIELPGLMCRMAPVRAGADFYGTVLWIRPSAGSGDARALDRAATMMSLFLLNQRSRDEVENQLRGDMLAELLGSPAKDPQTYRRRAELLQVNLNGDLTAVVAVPESRTLTSKILTQAATIARQLGGLTTSDGGNIVFLIPSADASLAAAGVLAQFQQGSIEGTVGAAGPFRDLAELPEFGRQARRCANALTLLGRHGQSATARELGFYGLLLGDAAQEQVKEFVADTLHSVEAYDRTRGTDLIETIGAYFAHDGQISVAAASLFIHPNTMYQRLERVDEILGHPWRTREHALQMRLALHLRSLSET